MDLNTKIILCNNGKKYLSGRIEQFYESHFSFCHISWRGVIPKGYDNNELFKFIFEKVLQPKNFGSYEGDYKCYGVDYYSYNTNGWALDPSKPVQLFENKVRVLVEGNLWEIEKCVQNINGKRS